MLILRLILRFRFQQLPRIRHPRRCLLPLQSSLGIGQQLLGIQLLPSRDEHALPQPLWHGLPLLRAVVLPALTLSLIHI